MSWTSAFNLVGAPAISIPCGFNEEGLPLGLQIAGRRLEESTVLRAAFAYEQQAGWHKLRPSMAP
jgi:aspartyl-tRNA(Asn)/glutamyl-tRNA(Gln) amidotransferase subunit A